MQASLSQIYHPATMQLLKYRSKAKLASIASSFKSPRRKVMSVAAILLGVVWLSQAIASVMFRESAARADLLHWIPLGLFAYAVWHLIKISSRAPTEPFDWTAAEDEYVRAAPVTRPQLISYRLASIFSASLLKAFIFSVVMIPDLAIWMAGFVGMLLGLIFVDFIRVCFELFFHGLSKRGKMACRAVVFATILGAVAFTLSRCMLSEQATAEIASPGALLFFKRFVSELIGLASTQLGMIFVIPFQVFSQLILTEHIGLNTIGFLLAASTLVGLTGLAIYPLDNWATGRQKKMEAANYQKGLVQSQKTTTERIDSAKKIAVPLRLKGFGSIAWRQLLGAYHYRMTLIISLGVPTLLCCIPLFAKHNPVLMLINVIGGAVFYSFLLLPSALMLDFRRDVDRMTVLKALPISPLAMTLGQLAAPVMLCSLFQWIVLLIASVTGSVIPWQAFAAGFLLVPLNVLIFGIENFIFMLSPYRHNEEGIGVFLRTILTFTGKGILFAVALALTLGWALVSYELGGRMQSPVAGPILFAVGIWLCTAMAAAGFVYAVTRLYDRFDPSQDSPAAS